MIKNYWLFALSSIKTHGSESCREAKEEAATYRLTTHAHEYFTGTDALKIQNAITREPQALSIHDSRQ